MPQWSRETCQKMQRLKVKTRTDRRARNKLRPLFVNNTTGRRKHVALQNSWSPAVGSRVCIKGELCSAFTSSAFSPRQKVSVFSGSMASAEYQAKQRKIQVQKWDVTLLSPHHRCPTPQTRRPPHPPLPGRTDGCPSQTPLHTPG